MEKVRLVETGHVGKSRKENISLANKKGGGMLWAKGQKLKHLWGLVWETERGLLHPEWRKPEKTMLQRDVEVKL